MKNNKLPCEIGHTVWITQKYCVNDKRLWYGKVDEFYENDNNETVAIIKCQSVFEPTCNCNCEIKDFGNGIYLSKKEAKISLE